MTERERHESIARAFAEEGFLISYTRVYSGRALHAQWVPILQDLEVGSFTRYPRAATKLKAAEGAWKLFTHHRSAPTVPAGRRPRSPLEL